MPKAKRRPGFTILEIIIDTFIITAVFAVVVSSFILVMRTVNSGKVRTAAALLANEQMETLRNLPYDSLSTQNGTVLPQGTIPDSQTLTRSGVSYTLATTIITIDDPFDGCVIPLGAGSYQCTDGGTSSQLDSVPVDYKRITLEVRQLNSTLLLSTLSSNSAAKAAETLGDTGMLLICIQDADGQPVVGATVTVTNTTLGVNLTGTTNNQGCIFVANVPPDNHNGYHVVVTKEGYSTDFTTPRTSQNPNQFQPDLDVNAQQITKQILSIDQLANLDVTLVNELGQPLPNVAVTATSTKITQFNPETPKNVYNVTTNGAGLAHFGNIEWDSYSLTVPSSYHLITTSPYQPVSLDPNATLPVTFAVTTNSNWPRIDTVSPDSGTVGSTVTVVIDGDNFPGSTTAKLTHAGYTDVLPTDIDVAANERSITLTFNLTGVAPGNWNIVIDASNKIITQFEGFTVT